MSPLLLALTAAGATALVAAVPVSAASDSQPDSTAAAGGEAGSEFATLSARERGTLSLRLLHGAMMVLEGSMDGAVRAYEALARRYPDRPEAPMNLAVLKGRRLGLPDTRDLVVGVIEGDRALEEAWRSVGDLHARLAAVVSPDAADGPISGTVEAAAVPGAGGHSDPDAAGIEADGTEGTGAEAVAMSGADGGSGAATSDGEAAAAMAAAMLDAESGSGASAASAVSAEVAGEAAAAMLAAGDGSAPGASAEAQAAGAAVAGAAAAAMYRRRDGSSAAVPTAEAPAPSEAAAHAEPFSWRPIWLALGFSAAVLMLLAGVGFLIQMMRRKGGRSDPLQPRLKRAAAPLAAPAASEGGAAAGDESIFRPVERRTWLSALRNRIESIYPLLEARQALPAAVMAGVAGAAAGWGTLWFLRVPADWWTMPVVGVAGVGAAWYMLRTLQARQEAEFVRQFPEIVDHIVRLAGAGVPALEALAAVANDAPKPVGPVLVQVRDGLLAGLDTGTTLRQACERVRIAEFTLFAAVIRLQRRAGGGISTAFRNLAETLRERRKTALKAKASTAQTRLTLLILAVMPAIVLVGQKFIAPESVEILFGTDQGVSLLRWGVALIVIGILVARGLAARATR